MVECQSGETTMSKERGVSRDKSEATIRKGGKVCESKERKRTDRRKMEDLKKREGGL